MKRYPDSGSTPHNEGCAAAVGVLVLIVMALGWLADKF